MKNSLKKVLSLSLVCSLSASAMNGQAQPKKALVDLLCPACCWHNCEPLDMAAMRTCGPCFNRCSQVCNSATKSLTGEEGALSDIFCNCASVFGFSLMGAYMEEKPELLHVVTPLVAGGIAAALITHRLEVRQRALQAPSTAAQMGHNE